MSNAENFTRATWHTWPDETGFWWFYGWVYKSQRDDAPEMLPCRAAVNAAGEIVVHRFNDFMYRSEAIGLFQKAFVPEPSVAIEEYLKVYKDQKLKGAI